MQDNIKQRDSDGKWVATCPYDQKQFEGDTREEALRKEGIYRAENHIDPDQNIGRRTDHEDKTRNMVRDWKKQRPLSNKAGGQQ